MNHYLYFMGIGNFAILISFLTENLINKFSLLGLGIIWIILGYFVQKNEMKLIDIKFDLKMLYKNIEHERFNKITNLLENILKELKGGKNGKNKRNSKWGK